MMNMNMFPFNQYKDLIVTIESPKFEQINILYNHYLKLGFVLINKYSEKKYRLFGAKTYFITMQKAGEPIEVQMHNAIKEERYEDVMRLREMKDKVHTIKF